MVNLRSFGALRCAPHILRIVDNPLLTSLAGLESIQSSSGLQQVILTSVGLASREGLSPLGAVLDCPTGAPGSPGAPANVSSFSVKLAAAEPELRDAASFCRQFVRDFPQGTSVPPAGAPLAGQDPSADASSGAPGAGRIGLSQKQMSRSNLKTGEEASRESRDASPRRQNSAAPVPAELLGPPECPMEVPVVNPRALPPPFPSSQILSGRNSFRPGAEQKHVRGPLQTRIYARPLADLKMFEVPGRHVGLEHRLEAFQAHAG